MTQKASQSHHRYTIGLGPRILFAKPGFSSLLSLLSLLSPYRRFASKRRDTPSTQILFLLGVEGDDPVFSQEFPQQQHNSPHSCDYNTTTHTHKKKGREQAHQARVCVIWVVVKKRGAQ